MKKWMCVVMTAVLCGMMLTACGSGKEEAGAADVQEQAAETAESAGQEDQDDGAEAETEPAEADDTDGLTEAAESEQQEEASAAEEQSGKVLVVYYSASGNTKAVAETIAQYTAGDTFEIVPVEAYTDEDLNWTQDGSRVNREHEDESLQDIALVSTTADNFDSYDTVFIGYPIWWHEAAWVVNNFVKNNDFTGKTVIPFCTSSSSGLGESGIHLAEMAGTGDWQEGMRFSGNASESEMNEWLDGLDL